MSFVISRASGRDAPALVELAAEHAIYEQAQARPNARDLAVALDALTPRFLAWVAVEDGQPLGYASVTEDFSTWRAKPFLHLDCLFVREAHRGRGVGAALFREAERHARTEGLRCLEWQTPSWNADAIRFYERLGGRRTPKVRFTFDC